MKRPIWVLALLGATACSGSETAGAPSVGGSENGGNTANGGAVTSGGSQITGGARFDSTGGTTANGGNTSNGGAVTSGGSQITGGARFDSTGGTTANGGSSLSATGANTGTSTSTGAGGETATGGTPPTGGGEPIGGTAASGGSPNTGGALATGGVQPTGGATNTSETSASTGGSEPTGGTTGAGGNSPTGGTTAGTGGSEPAGGTTGTGGSTSVSVCSSNLVSSCNSVTGAIECHFGGSTGNYLVTVELGGDTAGDMYVEAEMYRRMLPATATAAGQTKTFSFTVNVRQPEGQPLQNGPNDGTPGLDVYIRGNIPLLKSICYQAVTKPPMLWIAGDSTVCDQTPSGTAASHDMDYAGWGQELPQFFDAPLSVANYADSGESSGSFLGSWALWGAIKAGWKAGDWVFVQLGHNDKTTTAATFQSNMTAYVTQAKAAGVNIVLITPTSRVGYALADEHVNSVGANLPQIIRDIGVAQNVPVIDLTVTTWNWIQSLSDWHQDFALGTDRTHTNLAGATAIAGFVRDAVKTQNIGIGTYLR